MLANIPKVIAHRGLSSSFPENTSAAFSACVQNNIKATEFDIQLTKDNIPVVFHDANLLRIANYSAAIHDLSFQELQQLDFGAWYGPMFSGLQILSYENFLSEYAQKLYLCVEIKTVEISESIALTTRMKRLIEEIIELSLQYSTLNNFCLLCFEPSVLTYVRSINPNIYTLLNLYPGKSYSPTLISQFDAINVEISNLSISHRKNADASQLDLFCYCCDTEEQYIKARKIGCDYFMSNKPDWLLRRIK